MKGVLYWATFESIASSLLISEVKSSHITFCQQTINTKGFINKLIQLYHFTGVSTMKQKSFANLSIFIFCCNFKWWIFILFVSIYWKRGIGEKQVHYFHIYRFFLAEFRKKAILFTKSCEKLQKRSSENLLNILLSEFKHSSKGKKKNKRHKRGQTRKLHWGILIIFSTFQCLLVWRQHGLDSFNSNKPMNSVFGFPNFI